MRLKSQHAAAAEFSQPRQGILQTIDLPDCVQFIDHKPKPAFRSYLIHRFENGQPHPGRYLRAQGCDLCGLIRDE